MIDLRHILSITPLTLSVDILPKFDITVIASNY